MRLLYVLRFINIVLFLLDVREFKDIFFIKDVELLSTTNLKIICKRTLKYVLFRI